MNTVFNDIALAKSSQMSATRLGMSQVKVFCLTDCLRGGAVVTFQDAAKFGLATNRAFRFRNEVFRSGWVDNWFEEPQLKRLAPRPEAD